MARKTAPAGGDPFVPDQEFRELHPELEMIKALWGGTRTMREAGKEYLPPYEAEDSRNYDKRLSRATLLGVFRETVEFLTGRVFQKPITLNKAHDDIYKFLESVDQEGNDWNVFLYDTFKAGLRDSSVNVFVDYPTKGGEATSLGDIKKMGLRPYWVRWEQDQILGCRVEGIGATERLKQVRVFEEVREDVGEFGSELEPQVRVYQPGKCDIYRKEATGKKNVFKIVVVDSKTLTGRDGKTLPTIPVSTFYTNRVGPLYGYPPLLDLAYKNVEHYQVYSDYLNCLIVSLFPILVISGWEDQTKPGPAGAGTSSATVAIGPTTFIKLRNHQAKVSYAEHTGAALGQGVTHLNNLKEEMAMYGLRPLVPKPGGKTATGEAIDEAREISELQAATYRFRDFVENVLIDTARWLGLDETAIGEVLVNEDLSISVRDAREIDALRAARERGDISRQTFWEELQRRGVLSDRFNVQDEEQRLMNEYIASPGLEDIVSQFGATGEGGLVQ